MEDLPKTWDAFYDFFKEVQKKLRAQGERKVYGLGFQLNTTGNDCNLLFDYFLIAYGGEGVVGQDGKLHLHQPAGRQTVVQALTPPAPPLKRDLFPPGASQ